MPSSLARHTVGVVLDNGENSVRHAWWVLEAVDEAGEPAPEGPQTRFTNEEGPFVFERPFTRPCWLTPYCQGKYQPLIRGTPAVPPWTFRDFLRSAEEIQRRRFHAS